MCRCDGEIVDHLLLHCEFAHMLSEVFLIFRIQWVMLENVTSLVWVEELVGEAFLICLKFATSMSEVVSLAGT